MSPQVSKTAGKPKDSKSWFDELRDTAGLGSTLWLDELRDSTMEIGQRTIELGSFTQGYLAKTPRTSRRSPEMMTKSFLPEGKAPQESHSAHAAPQARAGKYVPKPENEAPAKREKSTSKQALATEPQKHMETRDEHEGTQAANRKREADIARNCARLEAILSRMEESKEKDSEEIDALASRIEQLVIEKTELLQQNVVLLGKQEKSDVPDEILANRSFESSKDSCASSKRSCDTSVGHMPTYEGPEKELEYSRVLNKTLCGLVGESTRKNQELETRQEELTKQLGSSQTECQRLQALLELADTKATKSVGETGSFWQKIQEIEQTHKSLNDKLSAQLQVSRARFSALNVEFEKTKSNLYRATNQIDQQQERIGILDRALQEETNKNCALDANVRSLLDTVESLEASKKATTESLQLLGTESEKRESELLARIRGQEAACKRHTEELSDYTDRCLVMEKEISDAKNMLKSAQAYIANQKAAYEQKAVEADRNKALVNKLRKESKQLLSNLDAVLLVNEELMTRVHNLEEKREEDRRERELMMQTHKGLQTKLATELKESRARGSFLQTELEEKKTKLILAVESSEKQEKLNGSLDEQLKGTVAQNHALLVEVQGLREKIEALEASNQELDGKLRVADDVYLAKVGNLFEEVQAVEAENAKIVADLLAEVQVLRDTVEKFKVSKEALEEILRATKIEHEKKVTGLLAKTESLHDQVETLKATKQELMQNLATAEIENEKRGSELLTRKAVERSSMTILSTQLAESRARYSLLETELDEAKTMVETAEAQIGRQNVAHLHMLEAFRAQYSMLERELEKMTTHEKQAAVYEDKLAECRAQYEVLENELEDSKNARADYKKEIAAYEEMLAESKTEYSALQSELEDFMKRAMAIQAELDKQNTLKQEKDAEIDRAHALNKNLRLEISDILIRLDAASEEKEKLDARLFSLQKKNENDLMEKDAVIADQKIENQKLSTALEDSIARLNATKHDLDRASDEVEKQLERIGVLDEELRDKTTKNLVLVAQVKTLQINTEKLEKARRVLAESLVIHLN